MKTLIACALVFLFLGMLCAIMDLQRQVVSLQHQADYRLYVIDHYESEDCK